MNATDLLTSKIPPHSLEAERAVLGAIMLERESLPKAVELLRPQDFYKEGHRQIFATMVSLFERSDPVDLLTLTEELRRRGELDEIGGPAALAAMVEEAATAAHLETYAGIVIEKAVLRELIRVSTEIIGRSYETRDANSILEQARSKLDALTFSSNGRPSIRAASELTAPAVEFLTEDLIPCAMLTTLSGRDKRGKTLLALEVARAILTGEPLFEKFKTRQGPAVCYLLDDPPSVTLDRLATLGVRNHPELFIATGADVDLADPLKLLRRATSEVRRVGARFVAVDALYLLMPGTRDAGNDQVRMRPVMLALNALAEETGAAVLLIAHDNKAGADVAGSHVIRAASKAILRLLLPHGAEEDPDEGPTTPERVLRVESKLTPGQTWRLRLDGVGAWHLHGTQREARATEVTAVVRDWLAEGNEGTTRQIAQAVGRRWEDVQAALTALTEAGEAGVMGTKTKGRPRRMYRGTFAPDDPEQKAFAPNPREQKSTQNTAIFKENQEGGPFCSGPSLSRETIAGAKVENGWDEV